MGATNSEVFYRKYGEATTIYFPLESIETPAPSGFFYTGAVPSLTGPGGTEFRVNIDGAGWVDMVATSAVDFAPGSGIFSLALPTTEMSGQIIQVAVIDQVETDKAWQDKHIRIETYGHDDALHPAMNKDVYHADINVCVDNDSSQDEYTVTWFRNGVVATVLESGVLEVIDRTGAYLFSTTTMSELSSLGTATHDEAGSRQTAGEQYIVRASGIVNPSYTGDSNDDWRTYSWILGRDS